jgi:GTPase
MIIIGSNMGVSKMTREHLGISLFLKIPFMVVLTKIDIAPANVYEETISTLQKILKSKLVEKIPIMIKQGSSLEEINKYAELMPSGKVCPIFSVSSVTNSGFPELTHFLSRVNNRDQINSLLRNVDAPLEVDTNETFVVEGVGLVVTGIIKSGTARLNQQCHLGPDKGKGFKTVVIKSIHVNRSPRDEAYSG